MQDPKCDHRWVAEHPSLTKEASQKVRVKHLWALTRLLVHLQLLVVKDPRELCFIYEEASHPRLNGMFLKNTSRSVDTDTIQPTHKYLHNNSYKSL